MNEQSYDYLRGRQDTLELILAELYQRSAHLHEVITAFVKPKWELEYGMILSAVSEIDNVISTLQQREDETIEAFKALTICTSTLSTATSGNPS